MTTDTDLIAAFLAKKGATRVETGARAYTERSMYLAVCGEAVDTEEQKAEHRCEKQMQDAFEAAWHRHNG